MLTHARYSTFGPILVIAVCVSLAGGCATPSTENEATAQEVTVDHAERAAELAQDLLIVDTHIDVPYRLNDDPDQDISKRTEKGDFDYPRALAGGLNVAFMSVYVPASYQETGGSKEFADKMIDMVEGFEASWPEKFQVVKSGADAVGVAPGVVALAMGMENGAPIEGDLDNLRHFHDRGIRYITLTHSKNNHICDSSYETEKKWNGLSPFGREVVAEMNRLGIMIDISHLSDEAAEQVLELSNRPVIASHSSARHFTPGFERNMSDELIRKLAQNGGVLQINFGSSFLTEAANVASSTLWSESEKWAEENGFEPDSPEVEEWTAAFREQNPIPLASTAVVVDHIDHVVELAGIDHVGLGSDYDGVGPTLPIGLEDVSKFPHLIEELLRRGYSEEDIAKVCGGNLMRVWNALGGTA